MAPPTLLDRLAALDRATFHLVNVDGGPALDLAARVLSHNAFGIAWGLALAFALTVRLRRDALRGVLALGLAVAASDRIGHLLWRPLFGRVRPCYALAAGEVRRLLRAADVGSLPSLHASNLFALATAATLADRRLGLLAWPVALGVAWSRVYGGVHWPGDVLAGAAWGALAALAAWAVAGRIARALATRP